MKSVILVVLDGFGIAPPGPGNAIYLANPVNFNSIIHSYPNTTLKASGEAVGLPAGEVGNTEVGHINLGAGRVVFQDLPRINMSIADGSFYGNAAFLQAITHAKKNRKSLHLMGLLGEGSVHSCPDHLYALLYLCKEQRVNQVYIHGITDGRDSPPKSALEIIARLEEKLSELKIGKIASIMGRYYAMDRDRRWERTEKAYSCLTESVGNPAVSATQAIKEAYALNITDEFIQPVAIATGSDSRIKNGDAVIFFNYRIDRPRQLTKAFVLPDFETCANQSLSFDPYAVKYHKTHFPNEELVIAPFKRRIILSDLYFATMTEYEPQLPVQVAYPPVTVKTPLGRILSENNINQLRLSESEKERFVTFYFNGQRETPFVFEDRLIVPSPKVPTYDLRPEMSALELTDILINKIQINNYPFILLNYANADMVGHTGNISATIQAIKTLDICLDRVVKAVLETDTVLLITADHGNAEEKISLDGGKISTEHTDNPVPFVAVSRKLQGKYIKLPSGILGDVAPTILNLMDIPVPANMTGRNLLEGVKF